MAGQRKKGIEDVVTYAWGHRTRAQILIVVSAVAIWLSFAGLGAARGPQPSSRHMLRGASSSFPDYLDPQLSYTFEGWTAMYDTYIPLLTYRHTGGLAGGEVIPGLAKSLPKITNGGRTYTLALRRGLKYSNGQRVKASDFEFALERLFRLDSGGSFFYTDIVGAKRFRRTLRGGISGIMTNNKTGKIVIHLVKPHSDFTQALGLMFAAPVPPSTPASDQTFHPPAATGPYVITSSKPGFGWTYARNPEWRPNNAKLMPRLPSGHMGKIRIVVMRNGSAQVNQVERGKLDLMLSPPPANRFAEVKRRYQGTQLRLEPTLSTYYFWMNTTKAPFNDVKVRQAVNYAVSPNALQRIYADQITPSHQILPPDMPGYKKLDLYPYNIAKAKEMIKEAHPSDMNITVWTDNESPDREAVEYYAGVLKDLGFSTKLKIVNADSYFTIIGNKATPNLDTGWSNWYEDYPHPNDFFQPLLAGASILPTNNGNLANIDEPALNTEISKLDEEQLGPEQEAAYAELDRKYMELAPWVPYGARTLSTFVSKSIDLNKVIWNPTFGDDLTSFQFR
jgi:peptide/nickel transport system substrate-binding protein